MSTGCDTGGFQGGMNFENGGQLGKLQQLADEIAGSSQLDRALARLRRQGNRSQSPTLGRSKFGPQSRASHGGDTQTSSAASRLPTRKQLFAITGS